MRLPLAARLRMLGRRQVAVSAAQMRTDAGAAALRCSALLSFLLCLQVGACVIA